MMIPEAHEALSQIAAIRKWFKAQLPGRISVRNGEGTAWGWVDISGPGGAALTAEQREVMRKLGYSPAWSSLTLSPEDRRNLAAQIAAPAPVAP